MKAIVDGTFHWVAVIGYIADCNFCSIAGMIMKMFAKSAACSVSDLASFCLFALILFSL